MALKDPIENIRQITKPKKPETLIWVLIDQDTGEVMGTYTDENRAWDIANALLDEHRIDCMVSCSQLFNFVV